VKSMKRTIVALALCASFGAHAQDLNAQINNGIKGFFSNLVGEGSQESRIQRMQEMATAKIDAGAPQADACAEAFKATNAGKPDGVGRWTQDTDRQVLDQCMLTTSKLPSVQRADEEQRQATQAAWEADAPARERVAQEQAHVAQQAVIEKQAKEVADKKSAEQELVDIRAGTKKTDDYDKLGRAYGAASGSAIARAPKIRPDGKPYVVVARIDKPDPKAASFVAQFFSGDNEHIYAYVEIPKNLEERYFDSAKVNGGFVIVGTYKENREYKTVLGEQKVMPVFVAQYLDFL
jgi:hypothetical protein